MRQDSTEASSSIVRDARRWTQRLGHDGLRPSTRRLSGHAFVAAIVAGFASLVVASLIIASLVIASPVLAQGSPREGIDYTVVQPSQPTDAPAGKVEVVEFFGYWCPACNAFEATMRDWSHRNDAKIRMVYVPVPTHFRAGQDGLQKLYYALDVLGKESDLRPRIFAAMHVQRTLSDAADADAIADWVAANGVDRRKFVDVYRSFAVQARVTRADQMAKAYGLTGTPSLAIGGRYLLTVDARNIGNADTLLTRALSGH